MALIRFGDLPPDMQQIIVDYIDEVPDDLTFTVREIPVDRFPELGPDDLDDSRGHGHAMAMADASSLPPVLLYGSKWLDGMHRVYAARQYGRRTVPAIDLAEHGHALAGNTVSMHGAVIEAAGARVHRRSTVAEAVVEALLEDADDLAAKDMLLDFGSVCPECGSKNVSRPDFEGLVDCLDCGIWFNPLRELGLDAGAD